MIKGCEENETGFGIATYLCDNEHPIIEVYSDKETVSFYHAKWVKDNGEVVEDKPYISWSFDDYIKLSEDDILKHYNL